MVEGGNRGGGERVLNTVFLWKYGQRTKFNFSRKSSGAIQKMDIVKLPPFLVIHLGTKKIKIIKAIQKIVFKKINSLK